MHRRFRSFALFGLLLSLVVACSSSKLCTAMGCRTGVVVTSKFTEPGSYVFDVTVDGVTTTCRAHLPFPEAPSPACGNRSDIILMKTGLRGVAGEQSLDDIMLSTTTAKSIAIKVTRDGAVIAESTVAPPYETKPGPNGPDCDPPSCTFATYALGSRS